MITKIIKTMIVGRTYEVRLGTSNSRKFNMPAGVPQGSVAGPILFNLYIHDLPKNPSLKCIQFADDTSFYATHAAPMIYQCIFNNHLITLSNYFREWKMILNNDKTIFANILGMAVTNKSLRKLAREMHIKFGVAQSNTPESQEFSESISNKTAGLFTT